MNKKAKYTKIGALWLKFSRKTGREFLAGSITLPHGGRSEVVMFVNRDKGLDDDRPHYIVYRVDYVPQIPPSVSYKEPPV